jgi:hypothetical protein
MTDKHHRLLNSGLDRLEADVPSHSLARARVGSFPRARVGC